MKIFNNAKFDTLEDLLVEQIEDLYDAENRLCDALPKMADAASSPELKNAFTKHLDETKGHVSRLDRVFDLLGRKPTRDTCDAMKGLISEGEDMIDAEGAPAVRDAALIAAAQRVEHYEMAGYGATRSLARQLGRDDVATILQQTLDEEGRADHTLTDIAETTVNPAAALA